jgi:sodium transport system permease protein
MNWTNIKLIFLREVRDQLRDRRTLFMVAVLPILLYPALGVGMVWMTVTFAEQVRRVAVVGMDEFPSPPLIQEDRFVADFFDRPEDVEKLEVITDAPGSFEERFPPETQARFQVFFDSVPEYRETIDRLADIEHRLERLRLRSAEAASLEAEGRGLRRRLHAWFSQAPAQVLILFPESFLEQYRQADERLAAGTFDLDEFETGPRPVILHNSADEKSEIPYQRVRRAVRRWEETLLTERLRAASLPASLMQPVPVINVDLAEPQAISASVWSKIFPALLVIMSVTGAFYPAIDLGAGEKERGTMETLLISPATRTEIVLGKFLTVMLFSLTTALLNLASMGLTGKYMVSAVATARTAALGEISFPPPLSLLCVILLAIPLSALFSALSLSLAMFARSSKEGQYYLTPLLMVTMGLTIFCMNPGVELNGFYSVLPVIGPALLLKALLLGVTLDAPVWIYAIPVLVTSCAYSVLALWWAIDQFQREDILFREAEQFEIGLWVRHLLREKEPTPSFAEAGVCFVLIALLQFGFLMSMQGSAALAEGPASLVTVQLIYLIATVGVPPLFMALLLTTSMRQTLKLTWPDWRLLVAGGVLAFTLQPLALELLAFLDPFFPPAPPGAKQIMEAMATGAVPLWLTLTTFALAPAVCEELAFRGFILSGLQRSRHRWLPIVISAVLFGVIHMIPKQQFNAALLGLVLGLLAVRSRSLLPCVLFHFIFNGSQVLLSRLQPREVRQIQQQIPDWLISFETVSGEPALRFGWPLLLLCMAVSAPLIAWMIVTRDPADGPKAASDRTERGTAAAEWREGDKD